MKSVYFWLVLLCAAVSSCSQKEAETNSEAETDRQPTYQDVAFQQDYSIKYTLEMDNLQLLKVMADRNGVVQVLSSKGLLRPFHGEFLYPGTLESDLFYHPMQDKKISGATIYQNQFVYVDNFAVLSNAWAGEPYFKHNLRQPTQLAGGKDFSFLIAEESAVQYIFQGKVAWSGKMNDTVLDLIYDATKNKFWILSESAVAVFNPENQQLETLLDGNDFTSFALTNNNYELIIGTLDGYFSIDTENYSTQIELQTKLPNTEITAVVDLNGSLWFGTTKGAFKVKSKGKYDYYASKRWLPSDKVIDITKGPDSTVLILTDAGLSKICFKKMNLHDKAMYYETVVRDRHIRHGFNATIDEMEDGDLTKGVLDDSDNDGLWTSMYLGGEVFRYAVTKSEAALQNCRESLDAMERLYTINPVPGFPSRSFERSGYISRLGNPERWQHAENPEWDWKATTSSDEAIGHVFVFGAIAELIDDENLRQRSIKLLDTLMQHIVDNDMYLVDFDGKPTTWGRWNPEYVNARPKIVGDRKINSSNIIAMLQTAYHFTKKEIYKEKAFELMNQHGYFENLMRSMKNIGNAPEDADDWSKMLSEEWNHSDDEMYFLGYWGLYRYAFNDTLKAHYKDAIIDHWEAERPEKEGAWNIMTALTGTNEFDLDEAIWYLQEYPLDLISWQVENSHRKDIVPVASNFRGQTIEEVLPPDETPIRRHNGNRFELDGGDHGDSEYSPGDIWLLPYWMGRYLGVISSPNS